MDEWTEEQWTGDRSVSFTLPVADGRCDLFDKCQISWSGAPRDLLSSGQGTCGRIVNK